jgi:hypothetical protein
MMIVIYPRRVDHRSVECQAHGVRKCGRFSASGVNAHSPAEYKADEPYQFHDHFIFSRNA